MHAPEEAVAISVLPMTMQLPVEDMLRGDPDCAVAATAIRAPAGSGMFAPTGHAP